MAWQKGQSGNPNGRGKDKLWGDAIRLEAMEAAETGDRTKLRALAEKLFSKALEGDVTAMKEIGDRLDGKPAQSVDVTHRKTPAEMSDDELYGRIAEALTRIDELARRTADETDGEGELPSVH